MYEQVTAIISRSQLSASSSACHGLNHYRDNAITYKAQRDKNAGVKLANAAITDGTDASAWCCCARCKIHGELADAKAENDALRDDDVALVVVSLLHQSSLSVSAWKPLPPPAWIMQPPRLADTAERDYFTLQRGWSLCKNNWKEPRSILMSSADRVAHIDGQLMQLLWAIHTRFQRSINA